MTDLSKGASLAPEMMAAMDVTALVGEVRRLREQGCAQHPPPPADTAAKETP